MLEIELGDLGGTFVKSLKRSHVGRARKGAHALEDGGLCRLRIHVNAAVQRQRANDLYASQQQDACVHQCVPHHNRYASNQFHLARHAAWIHYLADVVLHKPARIPGPPGLRAKRLFQWRERTSPARKIDDR